MEKPVCLISTDSEGQLCVVKEAKEILDRITQPVVVVSIVGLYRTGKSYLMNRLAGQQTGFALGGTIESQTKGIWMWCVPHPKEKEHTLVLLDTEGLGDIDKGDETHDTWIFCLAVLLSSTLVYNSLGVIDSNALKNLKYVTKLSEHIRVKAQTGGDHADSAEFMRVFPSFIWAVRDFTLKLEKEGKPITADEYLDSAVELKPGALRERLNKYKHCLQHFFAERRCFVFPRPAGDDDLARIEELSESDLKPQFLKRAEEFCTYVFSSAKPKTLTRGQVLPGTALCSLAELYVEAIRHGQIPCLENAIVSLAKIQNERAVEQGLQVYQSKVLEFVCFPVDPSELSAIHREAETAAIKVFISNSFNDTEQKAQLKLMIQTVYQDLCDQNREESLKVCEKELTQIFSPLEEAVNDGSFLRPGGYGEYCDTLQSFKNEYRARTHKQLMSEEVLIKYLKEKEQLGKNILLADQNLAEAEQKQEEERIKNVALELKTESLIKEAKLQEQKLKDQKNTCDENVKQLEERMKKDRQRAEENNKQVLEAKHKEQEDLLNKGFKEESESMKQEIKNLEKVMKTEDQSIFGKIFKLFRNAALRLLSGIRPRV